jgi:hypothetical protein
MQRGYTRDKAGKVADVLGQAGVWPEFRTFRKIMGKIIHEPDEAHDLWVRMSEPKLGKDMAVKLANLMTHFGWAPQQKIMPEKPFLEAKQDLSIVDFTRPQTIHVLDAGYSSEHNSLGTVESLGAGRTVRSKPGYAGRGFGFEYFTRTKDGMPIRATLKVGNRIMNPGDKFYDSDG